MNRAELKAYIRYHLMGLSTHNGHHEFEALSYEIARLRVASNLLPATGPVASGGDQGRDFESYKTYLTGAFGGANVFLGLASKKVIVGACSLEKITTLPGKVRGDLTKIFSSNERPQLVCYFCEQSVPVAKRHELQDFCLNTYGATLNFFDGDAISDILVDSDTFWIAEQFLAISSDVFPRPPSNDYYSTIRARWIEGGDTPTNVADFIEIKTGVRTATSTPDARVDLQAWISLMKSVIDNGFSPRLEQRGRYEVCVAELRGAGSLDPALSHLHRFFDLLSRASAADELLDAAVLVTYAIAAQRDSRTTLTAPQIVSYLEDVERLITETLSDVTLVRDRCTLLEASAMVAGISVIRGVPRETAVATLLERWAQVVEVAKSTPLFPLAHIGEIFQMLATEFTDDPRIAQAVSDVDSLVAEARAAQTIGERARDRAMAHLDSGQRLAALNELHRVRSAWLSGDTIDGSILAMLLISQIYGELHLYYAARYYAAGALLIALNENSDKARRMIGKAAFKLADAFYRSGEGVTFVYSIGQALRLHNATAPNSADWNEHEHVKIGVAHTQIQRAVLLRIAPILVPLVDAALETWPLSAEELGSIKQLSEGPPWSQMSIDEIEQKLAEELGGTPFADLGQPTYIEWMALGLKWTIRHPATSEARIAAVSLAATLQIILADLANIDLAIIPSSVEIQLVESNIEAPSLGQLPDNGKLAWTLEMPVYKAGSDPTKIASELVIVAVTIVEHTSALSDEAFGALLEEKLKAGLAERAISVRPPRELFEFAQPPDLDEALLARSDGAVLTRSIAPLEAPELRWPDREGPGYTIERAGEMLENRYKYGPLSISLSLPRILADRRCRKIVNSMKAEGMLDWQIFSILASIVGGWQAEKVLGRPRSSEDLEAMRRWLHDRMHREESSDDPEFQLDALTDEIVRMQKQIQPLSSAKNWGLTIRRQTPDGQAVKKFLDVRYRHSTDDIPHGEPFPDG